MTIPTRGMKNTNTLNEKSYNLAVQHKHIKQAKRGIPSGVADLEPVGSGCFGKIRICFFLFYFFLSDPDLKKDRNWIRSNIKLQDLFEIKHFPQNSLTKVIINDQYIERKK